MLEGFPHMDHLKNNPLSNSIALLRIGTLFRFPISQSSLDYFGFLFFCEGFPLTDHLKNNPAFYFLVTFSLGTLPYLLAGRRR
jgi:hypothetical protein